MPIARLLRKFTSQELPAFSDEDLAGEWTEAMFVNKAVHAVMGDLGRQAKRREFRPVIGELEANLRKFKFGTDSVYRLNQRYQFPRQRTIREFCRRPEVRIGAGAENLVINQSPERMQEWIIEDLIPSIEEERAPIYLLIGGVGSGKTTFNKFLTTRFFSIFKARRIFTSRIEYRKMYEFINGRCGSIDGGGASRVHLQRLIKRFIYCCMVRDLFHYSCSKIEEGYPSDNIKNTFCVLAKPDWDELNLDLPESRKNFAEFIHRQHGRKIDPDGVVQEVRSIISVFMDSAQIRRKMWFLQFLSSDARQLLMEPYVEYAICCGIRPHIIIDGLDYIQISDFLGNTSHCAMIEAVADWLRPDGREISLLSTDVQIYPSYQVTLRVNTYEFFWRNFEQSIHEAVSSFYYVVPAEFRDVFHRISLVVLLGDSGIKAVSAAKFMELFDSIERSLINALRIKKLDAGKLFMQNLRYRLHFTRNVIEELVNDADDRIRKEKKGADPDSIVAAMLLAANDLSHRKHYRLVDMLLHSKNERFANFVRIEDDRIDLVKHENDPRYIERVLRDNNIGSGYIGNIFNYHIPYRSSRDFHFFLEKLRILEVLIEADKKGGDWGNNPVSKAAIEHVFHQKSWPVSDYFDFSLAILVRENFIMGYSIQAGARGYVPTPLAKVLRDTLLHHNIYLENVFFGMFMPLGIRWRAKDIYRRDVSRVEWVAASIFHCWLILRMVRTAEGEANSIFFEEIRKSISATVGDIARSSTGQGDEIAAKALGLIETFEASLYGV